MAVAPQVREGRVENLTHSRRFKIRFRHPEALQAAQAMESPYVLTRVTNGKRGFIGVQVPFQIRGLAAAERGFDGQLYAYERELGGEIVEDYRYDLDQPGAGGAAPDHDQPSLKDVLKKIRAYEAWNLSRGAGVSIAIVDTGIDGTRPEFPAGKRQGAWQPLGDDAWTDWDGHGTMCACIAAGTTAEGGVFDGVAPEAGLIACKTHFYDSELASAYDYLISRAEEDGLRIVTTNSFGFRTGNPPPNPADSDFLPALEEAIQKGIHVFFSAGNNHHLANGSPAECAPNTIWRYKSRADVMTVATCKLDGSMWYYSSRGPGQTYEEPGTSPKPDITAPTPESGRIVYGDQILSLPNGWGTSGACPQAAGLAALLLSKEGSGLERESLFSRIRGTASPLGHKRNCEGAGLLDCLAALEAAG